MAPPRAKIVVVLSSDGNRIVARVDPERPGAWKRPPYYGKLKEWARRAVGCGGQVLVCVGKRTFVIFPDRDIDVGEVEDDDVVISAAVPNPTGLTYETYRFKRDDPRVGAMLGSSPRTAIPL
jgi:hypothetical protein